MNELNVAIIDSHKLSERIEALLLESEGVITPEIDELLNFQESYQTKGLEMTVDSVCLTLERIELVTKFYENQVDKVLALIKGLDEAKSKLKTNIKMAMETLSLDKLEGQCRSLSLRSNPPSVEVIDEALVTDDYKVYKMTETINKKAISEALKAGTILGWARLIQGKSVRIGIAKPKIGASNE